jgi:hypothetical protein
LKNGFPQKALPTIEEVPHFGRSTQGTRQITLEERMSYRGGRTKSVLSRVGFYSDSISAGK